MKKSGAMMLMGNNLEALYKTMHIKQQPGVTFPLVIAAFCLQGPSRKCGFSLINNAGSFVAMLLHNDMFFFFWLRMIMLLF